DTGPAPAGTSEISASRRSSRTPSRRASTDALIITGDTPYLPRWLVAELLQLSAVLVQPGRRALRRRQELLITLTPCLAADDVPDTEYEQAAQSQVFVLRRQDESAARAGVRAAAPTARA